MNYINNLRPAIKFILQNEHAQQILFLDVLIKKIENNSLSTAIYHKLTFSGQYLNFQSNHPENVKLGVAKLVLDKTENVVANEKI